MKMMIKKPCTNCLVKMRCMVDCDPYKKFKKIWDKGIYPGTFVLSLLMPIIYVRFIEGQIYLYILISYWLVTAITTAIIIKKDDELVTIHKDPFAIVFICLSILLFAWLFFVCLLDPYTNKKMENKKNESFWGK